MTTTHRSFIAVILVLMMVPALAGAKRDRNENGSGSGNGSVDRGRNETATTCDGLLVDGLESLPLATLDEAERQGLLFTREEEKLARDVYLTLYLEWGTPVFTKIARSEQQHMDAIARMLERYDLEDPVKSNDIGQFTNTDLAFLFGVLVDQGKRSHEEALLVGATIEDMDLFDLQQLVAEADQDDLKMVYQNLAKGSRNHLRAFGFLLEMYDIDYRAQYLFQEQVDDILSTDRERAVVYDAQGEPLSCGRP